MGRVCNVLHFIESQPAIHIHLKVEAADQTTASGSDASRVSSWTRCHERSHCCCSRRRRAATGLLSYIHGSARIHSRTEKAAVDDASWHRPRAQLFRPAKLPNKTGMDTPVTMEAAASPLLIKVFLRGYTVPPGRARVLLAKTSGQIVTFQ